MRCSGLGCRFKAAAFTTKCGCGVMPWCAWDRVWLVLGRASSVWSKGAPPAAAECVQEMAGCNPVHTCCSAADIILARMMPKADVDDFIVVADTGAYTLSMFSRCAVQCMQHTSTADDLQHSLSVRCCTQLAPAAAPGSAQLAVLATCLRRVCVCVATRWLCVCVGVCVHAQVQQPLLAACVWLHHRQRQHRT